LSSDEKETISSLVPMDQKEGGKRHRSIELQVRLPVWKREYFDVRGFPAVFQITSVNRGTITLAAD